MAGRLNPTYYNYRPRQAGILCNFASDFSGLMKNRTLSTTTLLLLVFFAGCSFLIYEVSYFRLLALSLGATVKASTLVLAAYMAGFGAGAWIWGRLADKRKSHHRLLMLLFTFSGILGLLGYLMISDGIPAIYEVLAASGMPVQTADRLITPLSLALLFVPAFFMGGILPVASGLIIRSDQGLAGSIGKIYAWETIGSAVGGLATGFVLIRALGQQNTVIAAITLNLLPALILLLSRPQTDQNPAATIPEKPLRSGKQESKNEAGKLTANNIAALAGTFILGFAVIGLQVVWFRIFKIYMTNTSYTFSLIASIVILGLFAGSRYFAASSKKPATSLSMPVLLLITAAVVVAGAGILIRIPELIMFPLAGDQDAYFMRIIVIPAISALLVILPVTFLSGYGFPLACSLITKNHHDVSNSMGRILLFNTLGSITGPAIAAFLLIPLLGAGRSVVFYALILLIAALLISLNIRQFKTGRLKAIAISGSLTLLIFLIVSPELKILPPSFTRFDREIIEYRESVEGTWVVGREPGGKGAALSTYVNNSAVIGSSYDAIKVVKMVGHLPFYAGLKGKDVLVVGFGIGVTTSAIASHPEVERIDCIELVAGLKDAAHYYSGLNNNIQKDKRLKVIAGDGRHYLQATGKKYDLISSDPTHPILGSGSLYTKEYFELCRSRLNPGGMVSQYLPLHKLLPEDFQGIIKTFHNVFPQSTVWLGHNHAVLLGVNGQLSIDFNQWSARIATSAKDPYFYNNPYHLAACLVLDHTAISRFPSSVQLNTDNFPSPEFFSFSSFDSRNLTQNLMFLNQNRCETSRIFTDIPDQEMMQRFTEGNRLLTEGIGYDLSGDRRNLIKKLREAISVNPENEEYPFLIRFYGSGR